MLAFLSTGHLVNDFHQGAIPALLPFLILQHNLSYSAAAGVVFTFTGGQDYSPLFHCTGKRFWVSRRWQGE